jgi:multiple sugar transport system permease protein
MPAGSAPIGLPIARPHPVRLARAVLLGPFLLLFAAFFVLPILYAFVQSAFSTKVSGLGVAPNTVVEVFVGFGNYARALQDTAFLQSIGRVLLYGVVYVPVSLCLALVLALALDTQVVKFRRLLRLGMFLPYAIPGVIAVIIWSFIYAPTFSPFLEPIRSIGPNDFSFVSSDNVLWAIANIALWSHTGYHMIVILAALQAIPRELYEAARVDGAGGLQIAWRIKIPLVVPTLTLVLVFSTIGTLQLFSEPLVLKSIASSIPSSFTPNVLIHTEAFAKSDPHYAAALAVLLAAVSFVLSFGFLRMMGRRSFESH